MFNAALAILVCGYLADVYGRTKMIIASGLIFIISVGILYFAHDFYTLFAGRLIQGISVGFITITVPLYLTETAPDKVRGMAVVAFQLLLTAGILLANVVTLGFEATGDWRGMFLTALVPGVIVFIGGFLLVKSPRWLLLKGRDEEALASLKRIRSEVEAQAEFKAMKESLTQNTVKVSFLKSLGQKRYSKPLLIVFAIAILAQLTGINSFLQFTATILKDAGFTSNLMAIFGSVAITALNMAATVIALLIADRFERKHLVAFGTAGVAITLVVCGLVLNLMPASPEKGWIMFAGLISFIFFFAVGPGAVIWVILSELLPTAVRSKGLAVALFLNSLASAGLAAIFLPTASVIGVGGMFIICGLCTFVYFLVAMFYIPKTRNQSLEEIEAKFAA